jgi:hypothetical protein
MKRVESQAFQNINKGHDHLRLKRADWVVVGWWLAVIPGSTNFVLPCGRTMPSKRYSITGMKSGDCQFGESLLRQLEITPQKPLWRAYCIRDKLHPYCC